MTLLRYSRTQSSSLKEIKKATFNQKAFKSSSESTTLQNMGFKQYTSLGLLSLVCFCSCQLEMGNLMALSLLSGGNMQMPQQSRNMAVAGLTGMTGDMSPMDKVVLTRAVKTIVGKHAEPDLALIRYAGMQGGQPMTPMQMIPYLDAMFQIAKRVGLGMPDGTISYVTDPTNPQQKGLTLADIMAGKKSITEKQLKDELIQRGMKWMTNRTLQRTTGFFF